MRWYLDFDGVLCDSLPEIWAVSRRAVLPGDHRPWQNVPQEEKAAFLSLRPYIRRGAEYLPLQRALLDGSWKSIASLQDWKNSMDPRQLEEDHSTLYRLRAEWLASDPSGWTQLNPPYPGIPQALSVAKDSDRAVILSTKKPEYVHAIVSSWGVVWPLERIEYSQSKKAEFLDARGQDYLLVDDQIDQLDFQSRVGRCILAGWGFVTPEALRQSRETWSLEKFLEEFRRDLTGRDRR